MLAGTPYVERLASAEGIIGRLRQRKLPEELARCQEACRLAQDVFDYFEARLRPSLSETAMADIFRERMAALGVAPSWEAAMCPNMNAGPHTGRGHVGPLPHVVIQPGDILNVDFGVKANGYSSDQQRMWYLLRPGESLPPREVLDPFEAVVGAIQAALTHCAQASPAVSRRGGAALSDRARLPQYLHALGHNVGTYAHDGGIAMWPPWPLWRAGIRRSRRATAHPRAGHHHRAGLLWPRGRGAHHGRWRRVVLATQKELMLVPPNR